VLPPPELEPPLVPPEPEPELPEEPEDDPPEDPEDPLLLLLLLLELLPEDDDDPFVLPVEIEPVLTLPPPRLPAMLVLIETIPLTLLAVLVPILALLLFALDEPLPAQGLLPGGNCALI
jgi:hypothetical protein